MRSSKVVKYSKSVFSNKHLLCRLTTMSKWYLKHNDTIKSKHFSFLSKSYSAISVHVFQTHILSLLPLGSALYSHCSSKARLCGPTSLCSTIGLHIFDWVYVLMCCISQSIMKFSMAMSIVCTLVSQHLKSAVHKYLTNKKKKKGNKKVHRTSLYIFFCNLSMYNYFKI